MIEYGEGTTEPKEIKKYAYKEKDVTELIKVYKIKSEKYTKKVIDIAKKYGRDETSMSRSVKDFINKLRKEVHLDGIK